MNKISVVFLAFGGAGHYQNDRPEGCSSGLKPEGREGNGIWCAMIRGFMTASSTSPNKVQEFIGVTEEGFFDTVFEFLLTQKFDAVGFEGGALGFQSGVAICRISTASGSERCFRNKPLTGSRSLPLAVLIHR